MQVLTDKTERLEKANRQKDAEIKALKNASTPPAKTEPADGWMMTTADKKKAKRERRRLRKQELADADGETSKPANTTKAEKKEPEDSSDDAMKEEESAVARKQCWDFDEFFLPKPPNPSTKDKPTAESMVSEMIGKEAAEAETIAVKREELKSAKDAIQKADPIAQKGLNLLVEKLEEEIKRLEATSGGNGKNKPARERAHLQKVRADFEVKVQERAGGCAKHDLREKELETKFKARMDEMKAWIGQVEEQFKSLTARRRTEWAELNAEVNKRYQEAGRILDSKIAALAEPANGMNTDAPMNMGSELSAPSNTNPQMAAAAVAAAAGDQAAILILNQLEHRVDVSVEELRDFSLTELSEAELPKLAHLYEWSNALLLEDAAAMVTFQQAGVPIQTMYDLVGDSAWKRMFPGTVADMDAVPIQLRQLMSYQMQKVSQQLQQQQYEEARKAGADALKASAQSVRAETAKLKKVKVTAKNGALVKKVAAGTV